MITYNKKFFNIEDTLFCGQLFRFRPFKDGFLVQSKDKACYIYYQGENVVIESDDDDYFYNYFDLDEDYSKIYEKALSFNIPYLTEATENGKGIRILRQDKIETLFSFMISQNNNIPRIKRSIEGLSCDLGNDFTAFGEELYAFPTIKSLAEQNEEFFKKHGLGYRASYFTATSKLVNEAEFCGYEKLEASALNERLMGLKGVGKKVADCVSLFGFHKTDSFPVDTWIEKVYKDHFNGVLTDRKKISGYFTENFREYSGYIQQYLFYYKRGK